MKRLIKVIVFVCIMYYLPAITINAVPYVENESCGKNASYTLSENGVLTISGTGEADLGIDWEQATMDKAKKIVIEEGITSIAHYGLTGRFVSEIVFPQSLSRLGEGVLSGYDKMKKAIIPDKVTILPNDTFSSCPILNSIVFPKDLRKIGNNCFKNCKSLKNLPIPDTVTYIGKNAFKGCKELSTITIPKKLKTYKADLTKKPKLTKVINHSSKTIPLDDCNGAKTWRVNGKKVKSVPPGKTATSKVARYKIIYYYSGGKAQGKCPKYYYYGKAPKLPKVKRKGYVFFGWFEAKNHDHIYEGFPAKQEKDAHMVAVLVKVKIRRIAKNKVKITLKDNIRWGTLAKNKEDLEYGYTYPKYKMQDYSIDIKEKTKTGKDKLVGGCYTRGNKSEVCKINPKKDLFIVISFDWKYESLPDSGDADIDDEMEIRYSGEKKFKIPAYKN